MDIIRLLKCLRAGNLAMVVSNGVVGRGSTLLNTEVRPLTVTVTVTVRHSVERCDTPPAFIVGLNCGHQRLRHRSPKASVQASAGRAGGGVYGEALPWCMQDSQSNSTFSQSNSIHSPCRPSLPQTDHPPLPSVAAVEPQTLPFETFLDAVNSKITYNQGYQHRISKRTT
ncbi:hypothetical protein J6590_008771 [Homalodisca vitripennis]|nr:hypothetical protein J6590_008771 [Homalodisca vitripennis]